MSNLSQWWDYLQPFFGDYEWDAGYTFDEETGQYYNWDEGVNTSSWPNTYHPETLAFHEWMEDWGMYLPTDNLAPELELIDWVNEAKKDTLYSQAIGDIDLARTQAGLTGFTGMGGVGGDALDKLSMDLQLQDLDRIGKRSNVYRNYQKSVYDTIADLSTEGAFETEYLEELEGGCFEGCPPGYVQCPSDSSNPCQCKPISGQGANETLQTDCY